MTGMVKYIGTKLIQARPMTRKEYNDYRGWELPSDEDGADHGYLVEYLDGGRTNDSRHDGYISWSPRDVFDQHYNPVYHGMTFGHALVALEAGDRIARVGWNGKGMWLVLIQPVGETDTFQKPHEYNVWGNYSDELDKLNALPWIGMKTADGGFVPWLASQSDVLAKDWMVIIPLSETPVDNGFDAELREAITSAPLAGVSPTTDVYLHGLIYGDKKQRFVDGTWVNTSKVVSWDSESQVATTRSGTRYKVSLAGTEPAGIQAPVDPVSE